MGVRTKHQSKPTAQLISRAFVMNDRSDSFVGGMKKSAFCVKFPANVERSENRANCKAIWSITIVLPLSKDIQVCNEDVLGFVKLKSSDGILSQTISEKIEIHDNDEELANPETIGAEMKSLTPLQQALALFHASFIRARNALHVLTKEEMSPFVSLVIEGAKGPYGTSNVLQL
ncbi:hypothetical protein BWQ96_05183 [Gracilariopsis chorda]|uniref:Uncharacterized protein n=1 Tax=Gracilariopsis chorda TaxID=448386 RepID=A0A2V3IBU9_9FLOR|nr:hypothetical protein BWQ96_10848 [Gracilariopsis chorda]PXF39573.1 hypothetical protein BWQ96_10730 [Gracilariopsis chorda]PXF39574.1 hypothetical protein BWQ96_10727 [Gracilariopsis chorda]PXF45081.1 hypothetical protein BWQ96_05183 [Gracilariopsis chorda]|eukprot:PXF39463.1 hypothetical protein BWQ96_10848 [Gracilariopsis chorda]